jgi:hypothetical protein
VHGKSAVYAVHQGGAAIKAILACIFNTKALHACGKPPRLTYYFKAINA